jgi:hypothetical protein
LPSGQPHLLGRLVVLQIGLLVKQQDQPKALDDLDRHGSTADCVQGHLHEIVGESTRNGAWSWHSGVLSMPGSFWEFISFYKKVLSNRDVICETNHLVLPHLALI